VAHPRRGSAYQHLASSGRVDVNALDSQRLPRLAEDGSLNSYHRGTLPGMLHIILCMR
jgi:hypothetical protein